VNNDLVKVHKDFTKLNIGTLSEKELELFYYICLNVKDIRDEIITMDFSSIKKSLGLINFRDLKKYILGLHQKLGNLHITNITNKKIETIFLFEKFINDLDNNTLTIRVTKDSLYFFNIANSYLRFLFSDVRKLSGKYSKLLVPYLMEFSHKKEAEFEKERFFNILEVEESYRNNLSDFNKRILKPAVEELKTLFENLKVERLKNGRVIKGYKFSWTNDFNFQNKKDNIEEAEVVEEKENKNIAPGELEKYFKTTFPGVNYYKNILNKSAYFSKLILEEKAVYKNHLPADYEELKVEERNRNIESTNTITSLKDLVEKDITDYEVRKNITPEQIEQEVLIKMDVTEEEYNKIKEDWILKQKEIVSNSDPKLLEVIFNASQSKKYNIINTKEEVNKKGKELHELEENIKRMQKEINKLKKEV